MKQFAFDESRLMKTAQEFMEKADGIDGITPEFYDDLDAAEKEARVAATLAKNERLYQLALSQAQAAKDAAEQARDGLLRFKMKENFFFPHRGGLNNYNCQILNSVLAYIRNLDIDDMPNYQTIQNELAKISH